MTLAVTHRSVFSKFLHNNITSLVLTRIASSRAPDAVFIEKALEEPILVVAEENNVDIIGPPDPVSNLRPIIRSRLINESPLQQKLRELQDATQIWNQKFWTDHNMKFTKERTNYIASQQMPGEEKRQLNADEMSEFYKKFLDENWHTHVKYNIEWYKKNFTLLFLALRVSLEKNVAKVL